MTGTLDTESVTMKLRKFLGYALGGLLGLFVIATAGALTWRASLQRDTRAARAHIDAAVGVDELFTTAIGGISQWFHVRGVHRSDPVLLWLHGGPGTPMMPFEGMFQRALEEHFIVVQWDQRGAGKTYYENPTLDLAATVDYALMVKDASAVVEMVKRRYGKERIVVVGHSWGSILGIGLLRARPDDIAAYVGTGQVVDITENEAVGYRETLAEARRRNDTAAITALEALAPYPEANGKTVGPKTTVLHEWEQTYGTAVSRRYKGSIRNVLLRNALDSPEYSLREIAYFLKDLDPLWPRLLADMDRFKAVNFGDDYPMPMFLFLGRHDLQTPSMLAASWLGTIRAPVKEVVWFEESAHSPMVDESEAFAKALIERVRPHAMGKQVPSASTDSR